MKRPTLRDLAQRHHAADWRAVPVVVRYVVPVDDGRIVREPSPQREVVK